MIVSTMHTMHLTRRMQDLKSSPQCRNAVLLSPGVSEVEFSV